MYIESADSRVILHVLLLDILILAYKNFQFDYRHLTCMETFIATSIFLVNLYCEGMYSPHLYTAPPTSC